jgi:hypothetical protein
MRNVKSSLIRIGILCSALALVAAEAPASSFSATSARRFIPTLAYTVSEFHGSTSANTRSQTGLNAGVLVDLANRSDLVLETGFLFRRLGIGAHTLSFLSIPAHFKYYFSGEEYTSPYIKLGLVPSILAEAEEIPGQTSTINTSFQNFELSGSAGLGGKFHLKKGMDAIVEISYGRALTTLVKGSDLFISSWNLSAGLGFSL